MAVYVVDQSHSTVGFTVRHAGIGKTRGHFNVFEGTIDVPQADTWEGASAKGTIDATSVDTKNVDRDNHLRSADFFDVEQFPEWTFESTAVKGGREQFTLEGNLTIHGVTQPVSLDVSFEGEATDPFGAERIAFEATTTISRKSYGLTWNAALEAGGVLVGDKVAITLEIEAVKQA
ncbi:YceI family protein [Actinomycetaceae bacterium WB03_NA08]|uniref:YceI family protein n=1 Tax=Scrofimicrobium canadense TaxID=2652290 RepID=A0A6N7VRP7_9ACTO|nr:YceI family protein [Scrofimicrobium canadense]MSS84447.1 YceI family protein [Scrofimicrobium canadense]